MPKQKTNSSAKKRFTGKNLKRRASNRAHINTKMTTKRKRNLRGPSTVHQNDKRAIKRLLNRA